MKASNSNSGAHSSATDHKPMRTTSRTPEGTWRWDAEGVRAKGYSDNVVDFMVGKLRQLPFGSPISSARRRRRIRT